MSRWQLFWAMAAMAAAPLLAETTTGVYTFRYSTLDRVGELAVQPTSEANNLSFRLSAETFDKAIGLNAAGGPAGETVTEWRPVAFVPPEVKVTAISVAIPGTDAPAFITVTPVVEEGETKSVQFDLDTDATATETVSLVGADGIAHTATLRIYKNTTGVTLAPGQACGFDFDDTEVDATTRNFYTFGGVPHLRVTGSATITRHVLNISDGGTHTFTALAGFDESMDRADQVFIVEFSDKGGTLNVDGTLDHAPLVLGTSVKSESAKVSFAACSSFTTSLSLRDGEGQGEQGGITFIGGSDTGWEPTDLLLACDFTLAAPLIVEKTVPIPAGRTFRLELAEQDYKENLLPTLSFADATSVLELALAGNSTPPSKYMTLLASQSGTLSLDQSANWTADLTLGGPGLTTTLILRDAEEGEADRTFTFQRGIEMAGVNATLIQEGGTCTLGNTATGSTEYRPLHFAASASTVEVRGGMMVWEDKMTEVGVSNFESGTTTRVTVDKGATLQIKEQISGGYIGEGWSVYDGVFTLTVAGTLELGGDLYMTPSLRRTLRVESGTLRDLNATQVVAVTCGEAGGTSSEYYLVVDGGATFEGLVQVDSVTGNGTLTLDSGATVSTLYAYNGTIDGTGMIDTFTGDLGDVTLGGDWLTGEDKTLADVVDKAQNYHGTLGFTAGTEAEPKTIDFASVAKLTELPGAFRVNDYQNITMRLDQYIDATVRWPSPATGVTLTLIESGAYGGEAEIPVVPTGVTFAFQYYDAAGQLQPRPPTDYQREPSEDGVSDELTWEDAVFTGQGAWIDVEFDKVGETYTSANTGWFNLGTQNGCLVGLPNAEDNASGSYFADYGKVTTDSTRFTEMGHPVSGGMILGYRPYIDPSALKSFPEEWSLAVRMTAPKKSDACMLAIGNNYDTKTASGNTYALVFATGAVKEDGTTEIVLWKFDGRTDDGAELGDAARDELFRVKVAAAQDAPHVFSVVCDGETLNLYMDGAWLNAVDVSDQTLSGGLQLGQQLGGSAIPSDIRDKGGNVMLRDGGAVDYIRFYKGAFPDAAMVEMADRTPYVRENLRYVRYVPLMTMPDLELGDYEKPAEQPENETWIQEDAWLEQTWDGTKWVNQALVDQPAEGAECRILVDAGEHTLQVNVERQVTGETDGDGQAVPAEHYFYSPNRTYASLVVRGQDDNGNAGILRLVPVGVDRGQVPAGTIVRGEVTQALDDLVPQSAWFTAPAQSTAANRTGFRYGTLRFTGGANDPINGEDASFYGAAYLRHATSGVGVRGVFDAGVCYLSKYAEVVLRANTSGNQIQSSLEMVAGLSLTRGVMDEVARWQLTGPVVVQGTTEAGRDYVLGHAGLPKDQASEDVWVPFFGADSTWKFYDDTRVEGGTDNANGELTGLFARGVQTPGRLYLDFTATNGLTKYKAGHNFSQQAWYRYNYEGEKNDQGEPVPGLSGMTAQKAEGDDFDHAVAFQIRLSRDVGDIVTLTLDKTPKARVQTFYVEEAEGTSGAPLTLTLKTADKASPLTVWQRVVAAARLDVSNNGHGTAEKDWAGNALNLIPESGRHTPVHRGNSKRGAYVVGPTVVDWNFGAESSVPRLEVAKDCELTFTVGQDLRRYGTVVAAQEGAWIHHVSDAPFLGQDVELGAGSTLGFHAVSAADADTAREEGVVLAGRLVLHGNATLRAEGGESGRTPRFYAAGGIVAEPLEAAGEAGQTGGVVLTVHADKGAAWRSRTAALTGDVPFGLRKTGPGVVTFDTDVPPSVSGLVSVDKGTLNVTAAADTPVGSAGLHVEAGATLADSGRMAGESRRVAIIPDGQTLSGGGTVDGVLRLESGATYVATQGDHLTVTGGLDVGDGGSADIKVILPTDYANAEADTPYLVSGVKETTVRRRLLPLFGEARWDAIAWLEDGSTYYAAREPALPVPGDFKGDQATNVWHTGFEAFMVNQYQSLGHAYVGATQGRTRAGTASLSASQINDALYAFSGISAFQPSDGAFRPSDGAETETGRTYIDAHNFFVAYEFGISSMAFTQDGERVVVEVRVRNALADTFPTVFARDAAAEGAAAFRTNTAITLQAVKGDTVADLPSDNITVTEVADLAGKPLADPAARATDVRYFALPYAALQQYFGDAPILLRPSASNKVELPARSEAL